MFSWIAKIVGSPAKKIFNEEMEAPVIENPPAPYTVPTWYEAWAKDMDSFNPDQRCCSCDNLHKYKEEQQNVYEIGVCTYYGLPCSAQSHCWSKHYRKSENVVLEDPAQTTLELLDSTNVPPGSVD